MSIFSKLFRFKSTNLPERYAQKIISAYSETLELRATAAERPAAVRRFRALLFWGSLLAAGLAASLMFLAVKRINLLGLNIPHFILARSSVALVVLGILNALILQSMIWFHGYMLKNETQRMIKLRDRSRKVIDDARSVLSYNDMKEIISRVQAADISLPAFLGSTAESTGPVAGPKASGPSVAQSSAVQTPGAGSQAVSRRAPAAGQAAHQVPVQPLIASNGGMPQPVPMAPTPGMARPSQVQPQSQPQPQPRPQPQPQPQPQSQPRSHPQPQSQQQQQQLLQRHLVQQQAQPQQAQRSPTSPGVAAPGSPSAMGPTSPSLLDRLMNYATGESHVDQNREVVFLRSENRELRSVLQQRNGEINNMRVYMESLLSRIPAEILQAALDAAPPPSGLVTPTSSQPASPSLPSAGGQEPGAPSAPGSPLVVDTTPVHDAPATGGKVADDQATSSKAAAPKAPGAPAAEAPVSAAAVPTSPADPTAAPAPAPAPATPGSKKKGAKGSKK